MMRRTPREGSLRILGIPGSLRRGSYNRMLLRAAQELCPLGVSLALFELHEIPPYNADLDAAGPPAPVQQLKEQILQSDALLIATPEYNHSVPGVLQNAIDWASRPAFNSVLRHKPVAIIGASSGRMGTVRSQQVLRQVLHATHSYVLGHPEVLVWNAAEQFDATGQLVNETTLSRLRDLVTALVEWTQRLSPVGEQTPAIPTILPRAA